MGKSFDGLCGLVSSGMRRSPTSGEVFVFLNCNRTHIKLLHSRNGRISKGKPGFYKFFVSQNELNGHKDVLRCGNLQV